MFHKTSKQIQELTLLLLCLTSWTEEIAGVELRRAWKGYDFDVLDQLYEEGLISGSRKAKSVCLTEAGIAKAEALAQKYLKGDRVTPRFNLTPSSLEILKLSSVDAENNLAEAQLRAVIPTAGLVLS